MNKFALYYYKYCPPRLTNIAALPCKTQEFAFFAANAVKNNNASIVIAQKRSNCIISLKWFIFYLFVSITWSKLTKNMWKSTATPARTLCTQLVKWRHFACIWARCCGKLLWLQRPSIKRNMVLNWWKKTTFATCIIIWKCKPKIRYRCVLLSHWYAPLWKILRLGLNNQYQCFLYRKSCFNCFSNLMAK